MNRARGLDTVRLVSQETEAIDGAPISRIRLLLVDGDDDVRAELRKGLENRFEVTEARTAKEALSLLRKRWFRAILTDYQLADRNGVWLLERVGHRSPFTWRVLMSKWSVPNLRGLRDDGVLHLFLAKPLEPKVFAGYFGQSA